MTVLVIFWFLDTLGLIFDIAVSSVCFLYFALYLSRADEYSVYFSCANTCVCLRLR